MRNLHRAGAPCGRRGRLPGSCTGCGRRRRGRPLVRLAPLRRGRQVPNLVARAGVDPRRARHAAASARGARGDPAPRTTRLRSAASPPGSDRASATGGRCASTSPPRRQRLPRHTADETTGARHRLQPRAPVRLDVPPRAARRRHRSRMALPRATRLAVGKEVDEGARRSAGVGHGVAQAQLGSGSNGATAAAPR